jgi:hypothetical protein
MHKGDHLRAEGLNKIIEIRNRMNKGRYSSGCASYAALQKEEVDSEDVGVRPGTIPSPVSVREAATSLIQSSSPEGPHCTSKFITILRQIAFYKKGYDIIKSNPSTSSLDKQTFDKRLEEVIESVKS